MGERASRLHRLQSALPPLFATQPESSAIGQILAMMAGGLEELDHEMEQVLRDRWVQLARGAWPESEESRTPTSLERLGATLGLRREEWEDPEIFRRRLLITVPVLLEGFTTPRSILTLAAAAFGAEMCPRLGRHTDTTVGTALKPGTHRRCAKKPCRKAGSCPFQDEALFTLHLTDNPPLLRNVTFGPLVSESEFAVRSHSFEHDRPVVTISAHGTVPLPALQNLSTRETLVYVGELKSGEHLTVWPDVNGQEVAPFESHVPVGHHSWRKLAPRGRAVWFHDGIAEDVSGKIHYLLGFAFDDRTVRFADDTAEDGPRFQVGEPRNRTPAVRPTRPEGESWRFWCHSATVLEASLDITIDAMDAAEPDAAVDVELEWWTRPPASFRLRIPKTPAVRNAEAAGAFDLLQRSVDRARAAGVHAIIDLPEPTLAEDQSATSSVLVESATKLTERADAVDHFRGAVGTIAHVEHGVLKAEHQVSTGNHIVAKQPHEAAAVVDLQPRQGEDHRVAATLEAAVDLHFSEDHQAKDTLGFEGIFDKTRLDWSRSIADPSDEETP